MGFFDKLMFWKKNDDLGDIGLSGPKGLGSELGPDGLGSLSQGSFDNNFGMPPYGGSDPFSVQQSPIQQQPMQSQQPSFSQQPRQLYQEAPYQQRDAYGSTSKDYEIISSKLDAIKANLESINQRLANIEAIARGSQEQPQQRRYYRY